MKISLFKNITQTSNGQVYDIEHMLTNIKNGLWQDQCFAISLEKDKEKRQLLKRKVPYFTTSGIFSKRNNNGLVQHSGLIAIDFDDIDDVDFYFNLLTQDAYTFSVFRSISAKGLCCIVKIESDKHSLAFDGLQDYYWNLLKLPIDQSCKDVSRPRYVSYDPDLYYNPASKLFKQYPSRQSIKDSNEINKVDYIHTDSKFERILNLIDKDITGGYRQWLSLGFAIASAYGTNGEKYYHKISSLSPVYDYDTCSKQYAHCIKYNTNKVTINTFYYYCKVYGINISDERENYISKVAFFAKSNGKKSDELSSMIDNITSNDLEVIEAVYSNDNYAPHEDKKLNIDDVELWIKSNYPIKKNQITRIYELHGKELESEDLNTIYIQAKKRFEKLSRELFDTIIFSNSTPVYNPIKDYFDSLQWDNIDRLNDLVYSINSDTGNHQWRLSIVTKWLIGIVQSIYSNEPNILCLVLAGAKNTGKTQFFKRLLPNELIRFFANSQLDKQKDDEILMTQKLIIFDDEYSGKSKQDAKHMKKMLSSDSFTLREPYGKKNITLRRVATLCGTCNETEILNDATGNRRIIVIEAIGKFNFLLYNSVCKEQLFAQIKHLYLAGTDANLSSDDIDMLEQFTASKYGEISIERESIIRLFELPEIGTDYDFKTTTHIKDIIETMTKQKLSIKKLGMELRNLGYRRIYKERGFGYIIMEKNSSFNLHATISRKLDDDAPF